MFCLRRWLERELISPVFEAKLICFTDCPTSRAIRRRRRSWILEAGLAASEDAGELVYNASLKEKTLEY